MGTVGELKKKLENVPDDYEVLVYVCTVGDTDNFILINDVNVRDDLKEVELLNK